MTTEDPVRFGTLLRHFRLAAGLTQDSLAERAGMSKRGLQDLERSMRQRPRRDTVDLLADALALSALDRVAFFEAAQRRSPPMDTASGAAPPTKFSMSAPAPLVGRERELLLLSQFLAGQNEVLTPPPVLLLSGEPGIAKTHLLQTLARQAAATGWCVLTGGSRRRGGEEPYVPLIDALAAHVRGLSPQARREVLVGCAWLGRLLPELEAPVSVTLSPDQERRLMYEAVGRFLTNVAGPAGTLLILDDLHGRARMRSIWCKLWRVCPPCRYALWAPIATPRPGRPIRSTGC